MSDLREAVVVAAARTPIGRARKGSLVNVRPDDLAAGVVREVVRRIGDGPVDEVVVGCGYPWGEQGFNVARAVSLLAGLTPSVPAHTVSRLCASSLQAVRTAHHAVAVGEADTIVAGGVESVSRVGRDRHLAEPNPLLSPELPGTTVADLYVTMIQTAENVAARYSVSREDMDAYAQRSQMRAVAARSAGVTAREIVPVVTADGREVVTDDGPRPTSTLEGLAALPTVLEGGTVTAGNASPLNDGAAAAVVMAEDVARSRGLRPLARIRGSAVSGVDPTVMGIGPVEATQRVLRNLGLSLSDIDVIEMNEAFAAQVIASCRLLGIDEADERLNPLGGAIALGHPFGMSGVRLLVTCLNALAERDGQLGLVTMCVGGGQGQALVIERI